MAYYLICFEYFFAGLILNITGGFKGTIPYLTLFGQLNEVPIFYLFEESDDIIQIPQLPVDYDFSMIEDNYLAFETLGKTKKNLPEIAEFKKDLNKNEAEAETEFNDLKDRHEVIEINSDGRIEKTVWGEMLYKKYEELFNKGVFHRQNILSKLIELKLYEYFIDEYQDSTVCSGKKIGDDDFDIDIYIENAEQIIGIEVKSGGNIPILINKKDSRKKKKETIEHKLSEGGFHHLMQNSGKKSVELWVIVYSHKEIADGAVRQMKKLNDKYKKDAQNLKWYWLKLDSDYKKDANWKVGKKRLIEIDINSVEG